jgi:hypothetical protein
VTDHFILLAIETHWKALSPEARKRCRARTYEGISLADKLAIVTEEAMKSWAEPPEVTERFQKQGSVATGKAGRDNA